MARCAAKSSTVSPVTLSETVESPQGLLAIADLAKPVKAADIEISKEGRDARVKNASAESSELESDLHSATRIPFRTWCSTCVASRAKEDPHWRKRTEDAQEQKHDMASLDFGFLGNSTAWEKTAANLCTMDRVSDAVFAGSICKAIDNYVIKAMVASVAN